MVALATLVITVVTAQMWLALTSPMMTRTALHAPANLDLWEINVRLGLMSARRIHVETILTCVLITT